MLHQHPRHIRFPARGFHIGGEQLQLPALAVLVEYGGGLQPTSPRRVIELAQVTQPPLPRSVGGAHGLDQGPVGVILAVLVSAVRPQKHSEKILSRMRSHFKRAGLHYIGSGDCALEVSITYTPSQTQIRQNRRRRDELGLKLTVQGSFGHSFLDTESTGLGPPVLKRRKRTKCRADERRVVEQST